MQVTESHKPFHLDKDLEQTKKYYSLVLLAYARTVFDFYITQVCTFQS